MRGFPARGTVPPRCQRRQAGPLDLRYAADLARSLAPLPPPDQRRRPVSPSFPCDSFFLRVSNVRPAWLEVQFGGIDDPVARRGALRHLARLRRDDQPRDVGLFQGTENRLQII